MNPQPINLSSARAARNSRQLINVLLACSITDDAWQFAFDIATLDELKEALEQCENKTGVIAIALRNAIASREP